MGIDVLTQTELFLSVDTATRPSKRRRAASPVNHPLPKRLGGRFNLVQQLGEGVDGAVWLAEDEFLGRQVAVKIPVDPDAVQRCRREARMLAVLDHPHIVPLLDAALHGAKHEFFVMKHIAGSNLRDLARQSPLSIPRAVSIVASIAEALHHVHQRGIVHRDVKPANILLDRSHRPYLADFGLALTRLHWQTAVNVSGTPAYMSPEHAECGRVDHRSDIFSLGIVLYELLTGERPFHGATIGETIRSISVGQPVALREGAASIPPRLRLICSVALAKSPQDRYSTASEMALALRQSQLG